MSTADQTHSSCIQAGALVAAERLMDNPALDALLRRPAEVTVNPQDRAQAAGTIAGERSPAFPTAAADCRLLAAGPLLVNGPDTADQRARDQREAGPAEPSPESAGMPLRDIREETAGEVDAKSEVSQLTRADAVRVPTADETAESVRRAQRALQELKQRQAADARLMEDDARTEAPRRHADLVQHPSEHEAVVDHAPR